MKTTTWLLVPLALTTASCLIELSPSAADPATTPVAFIRPDAAATSPGDAGRVNSSPDDSGASASPNATAPASSDASAPSAIGAAAPDAGVTGANGGNDASPATDAARL